MISIRDLRERVAVAEAPDRELDGLILWGTFSAPTMGRKDMWSRRDMQSRPLVMMVRAPVGDKVRRDYERDGQEMLEIPWGDRYAHFNPLIVPRLTENVSEAGKLAKMLFPDVEWGVVSSGHAWLEVAGQKLAVYENKIPAIAMVGAILNHPFFEEIPDDRRARPTTGSD